ncbi:MAG TPA: FCD domain-containing protein [Streptosporangiaceae bacterium]|nr:FCD domain-containing protein [Streptosporangiaceae bacterium]
MAAPSRPRPRAVELPGIAPVAAVRRSESLADQIRGLIISEGIAEGARLPAERDLAERFGASRPTVSQALRSLSLMGLIEIRHGSGAYVVRRPETMVAASVNLMLDLDQHSVGHLMRLRLWLETLGVREAAARQPALDAAEANDILAALGRLRGVTGGRPPGPALRDAVGRTSELIAADTVFHALIVRSVGNPYLAAMYESVHSAVLSYQLKAWVDTESDPLWLRDSGADQQWALHEPIAAAVIARDGEAAYAAVLAHHEKMAEHVAAARSWHGKRR